MLFKLWFFLNSVLEVAVRLWCNVSVIWLSMFRVILCFRFKGSRFSDSSFFGVINEVYRGAKSLDESFIKGWSLYHLISGSFPLNWNSCEANFVLFMAILEPMGVILVFICDIWVIFGDMFFDLFLKSRLSLNLSVIVCSSNISFILKGSALENTFLVSHSRVREISFGETWPVFLPNFHHSLLDPLFWRFYMFFKRLHVLIYAWNEFWSIFLVIIFHHLLLTFVVNIF